MQHFVRETIVRLAEARVEFVVVGGISAVLQGAPIVTVDLDICYRRTPANIAKLVVALQPLNPRARGLPPEPPFVFDERTIPKRAAGRAKDLAAIPTVESTLKMQKDQSLRADTSGHREEMQNE
jgi:hypothetical protein